jgi:hypothetical protein
LKTCIQCHRLVPELVQIKPGRGQHKPPQQRCPECAEKYRQAMKARQPYKEAHYSPSKVKRPASDFEGLGKLMEDRDDK